MKPYLMWAAISCRNEHWYSAVKNQSPDGFISMITYNWAFASKVEAEDAAREGLERISMDLLNKGNTVEVMPEIEVVDWDGFSILEAGKRK